MKRLVWDLEANGLLDTVDRIHCIVTGDPDTGEIQEYGPGHIEEGINALLQADQNIAHNGINYDVPVLLKVYPEYTEEIERILKPRLFDTLVATRLLSSERKVKDIPIVNKGKLPKRLIGSHSLEAWGHRMGLHKGDYAKEMEAKGLDPWAEWSPQMQAYCVRDVEVTMALLWKVHAHNPPQYPLELEHEVGWILAHQMRHGYPFAEQKAQMLYAEIAGEREKVRQELREDVAPWYKPKKWVEEGKRAATQTPKADNKRWGYIKGAKFTPIRLQEFNPGSDQQVADRLKALYGWEPEEFTPTRQPKVDGDTLAGLSFPLAQKICHYQILEKRCGQIAEGDQGWLKVVRNGRIHGYINQIGAVTGRATHSRPNIAQVPANDKPYGRQCRELFHVPEEYQGRRWKQLGTDMDGLELRCLGHYMAKYDGGAYIKAILEGDKAQGTDIHSMNARALGFDPTEKYQVGTNWIGGRDIAKRFVYGFLYGAGVATLGAIVGKGPKAGQKLKELFLKNTPALAQLNAQVECKITAQVERKIKAKAGLRLPDGRRVPIRHAHAALNTLLQGAGAIICKQWMVEFHRLIQERLGLSLGRDYFQLAWVHDELQLMVPEEYAHDIGPLSAKAARDTEQRFKWRCPLDASYDIGQSWAECH